MVSPVNQAVSQGAGTLIAFRVDGESARVLCRNFDRSPPPPGELIGEEPIRSRMVADVLGALVHKGHPSAVVMAFVADFLLPLQSVIHKHGMSQFAFWFGGAILQAGDLHDGWRLLNDAISQANSSGRADVPVHPLALFVLGGAVSPRIAEALATSIARHTTSLLDVIAGSVSMAFPGLTDSARVFGEAAFLADEANALARLREAAAHGRIDRWFYSDVVEERARAFLALLKRLREVLTILAKEPLTTATGVSVPKYRERTYADREAELQNELSSRLPPFHARVKVLSEECVVRIVRAPKGLSGNAFEARVERIRHQMRFLGVTRASSAIDREMARRQAYWQRGGTSDDPPPTRG